LTPAEIAAGIPAGQIDYINSGYLNLSERVVESLDFGARYLLNTDIGDFAVDGNATWLISWKEKRSAVDPFVEYRGQFAGLGVAFPEWRANASIFWTYKKFAFGPTINYISSYDDVSVAGLPDREIDAWVTLDLQASYEAPYDTTITVGCLNVTDEPPPYTHGVTENYDNSTHDNRGQFWYVKVAKKF
jgi:outer membrane receptor protein involved in Fe transport